MSALIIKGYQGYRISTDSSELSSAILANGWINQNRIDEKYNKYRLLSNDVDFFWGTKGFDEETLLISYKGVELEKIENPNNQQIIDYLNKYEKIPRHEFYNRVNQSKNVLKTQLELEIESLQVDKCKLLEQIEILKQIVEKNDEIKVLLDKLND